MHSIAIIALPGVVSFDLSTAIETFGRARLPNGLPAYQTFVCAPTPEIDAGAFAMRVGWNLDILTEVDTIMLPGLADPFAPVADDVLLALRNAAARGTRIASICVGAFTLAATGLLDGLRATTHWAAAHELARRYPTMRVDPNVLYVDNGQFLTSAGAAAGLDLCLHMIRQDYGAAVAANTARVTVMPLERDGGQAQFIAHEQPIPSGTTLEPLLRWMEENMSCQLTLEELAAHAKTSSRTLSRRFREQTGSTPMHWLNRCRLRRAQSLLETTNLSVERIGEQVGMYSSTTFRERFRQLVGISPQLYRRKFQG